MWYETRGGETVLLLGFLALAAVLAWVVVPAGIGAVRTPGVSPRTVPYGVAAGIAAVCLLRLGSLWLSPWFAELRGQGTPDARAVPDGPADDAEAMEDMGEGMAADEPRHPLRLLVIVAGCFLFAAVLVPNLGFYISGAAFMLGAMLLLGERRWPLLLMVPPALAAAVYGLFELGFSIRLPKGTLVTAWLWG